MPFFFKQWGEWGPLEGSGAGEPTPIGYFCPDGWRCHDNADNRGFCTGITTAREHPHVVRTGKRATGRQLDGREWNEMPGPQQQ